MGAAKLEVHEHAFISGPRSRWSGTDRAHLVHSHEGGDQPHEHPETGPASYTIDKDEWLRATGLRGGGRKKFTDTPSGEQLPLVAREPASFEVIVGSPPPDFKGSGGGYYTAARMILGSKMTVSRVIPFPGGGRRRA